MGSLLIAWLAGCTVQVEVKRPPPASELVKELALKTGVEVTDVRCPSSLRPGQTQTCLARTAVGDEAVDVVVDRAGEATATWRRGLIGGQALAAGLATLDDGTRHEFDCTGQVLVGTDVASVVVCPEVRRELAHVVVRGSHGERAGGVYYDDITGPVEEFAGGGASRIDCPSPEIVRGLAPFTCKVWRGDRVLEVTLEHHPEGWRYQVSEVDRGHR